MGRQEKKTMNEPFTQDELREFAIQYIQLIASGETSPTKRLSEVWGVSYETARDRLKKVRAGGWLPPGESGRVSTEPGPKLIAYWEANELEMTN